MKKLVAMLIGSLFVGQLGLGASAPSVTTNAAGSIACTGAIVNGTVTPNGANTYDIQFEYGLNTSYGNTVIAYGITVMDGAAGQTSVAKRYMD